MSHDSLDRPALTEVVVTPAMIEAGALVLSLKVDNPSGAHRKFEQIAREVFYSMLAASPQPVSSGAPKPVDPEGR